MAVGTPNSISLEYSTDNGQTFSTYTVGNTITLTNVDDKVLFRAGANGNSSIGKNTSNYYRFSMTGKVSCYGELLYLLNQSGAEPQGGIPSYCFTYLFNGCSALTTPPILPSTTLSSYCYCGLFRDCTSLTTAPELPATTLVSDCYNSMFRGCSSLNEIKLHYTGAFSSTYFDNWVYGVAVRGTLYYNGSDTTRGRNAIPEGWTVTTF